MNWTDLLLVSYAVLWIVVVLNIVIAIATLRTMGLVLVRLPRAAALMLDDEGPRVGDTLEPEILQRLGVEASHAQIPLVFLSTSCVLCRRLVPGLTALWSGGTPTYVLIKGASEEVDSFLELLGPASSRFARHDNEAFAQAGVEATPFALILDSEGRVREKGLVNNLQQLEGLIFNEERSPIDDPAFA